MPKDRIQSLDIAKGIGIILVVIGHLIEFVDVGYYVVHDFIYLFHMPLFFFISGIVDNHEIGFWHYFKKKFKHLYIPYLAATIFFFFVSFTYHHFQCHDGITFKNLLLAFIGYAPVQNKLSGSCWFLLVLFRVCLINKLLSMIFAKHKYIVTAIAISLGILAIFIDIPGRAMIRQTFVALSWFSLGNVIAIKILNSRIFNDYRFETSTICISIPILAYLSTVQRTNMSGNIYGNPLLFITGSIIGIIAILCISNLLKKQSLPKRLLSNIGYHSLSILIWHFFIFKIVLSTINSTSFISITLALILAVSIPVLMSSLYSKGLQLLRIKKLF